MNAGFAHRRSWGVELTGSGCARFRLWAPGVDAVSLVADTIGAIVALAPRNDGWFEVETDVVRVGQGYSFQLSGRARIPDPAARAQLRDVHGPSRLVDTQAYAWRTHAWRGRPWEEAVIYELHTGAFTPTGDFDGIRSKLDHLAGLGVTPQGSAHSARLALTSQLLEVRRTEIVPRLKGLGGRAGRVLSAGNTGLGVEWQLADGSRLTLLANLSAARMALPDQGAASAPASSGRDVSSQHQAGSLPAWSVVFRLADAPAA